MAIRYVTIPLSDDTFYGMAIALEGVSYSIDINYNERSELYYLSLYDADRNPLVLGVGLVPSYPITVDYRISNLTGFFWMFANSSATSEPYKDFPDKISQYYTLIYAYELEE